MPAKKARKRALNVGLTIILIGWLAVHYLLIGLYLLPSNAITVLYPEPIQCYVTPFFNQNWRLFAPHPPLVNERYLLQLSLQSDEEADPQLTEWIDFTTTIRNSIWSNPLSPAVTRHRTIEGIFKNYERFIVRQASGEEYEPSPYDVHVNYVFNRLLTVLAEDFYNPQKYHLIAVRGRVVIEEIPPFSESKSLDYVSKELKAFTFDWFSPAIPSMVRIVEE